MNKICLSILFAISTLSASYAGVQELATSDLKSRLITELKQDNVSALEKMIGNEDQQIPLNGQHGAVPLVLAAQHKARKLLHWLLQHGANVDALSASGSTALSMAAYFGHVGIIEALVAANAKLGLKSPNGYQALDWALDNQRIEAVEALILAWGLRESKFEQEKKILLAISANQMQADAVSDFQAGFSSFPLVLAIVKDNTALVESLLNHGYDPNQRNAAGYAALPTAARLGNPRIVSALLAHKANPNIGGSKGDDVAGALNQAMRGQRYEAAQLLIEAGAQVNKGNAIGITPLYICAVADTKTGDLTRLLLKHKADIGQKSDDGYNTLDVAMENRNRLYMRIAMRHMLEQSMSEEKKKAILVKFLDGKSTALPPLSSESSSLLLNLSILNGDTKLFKRLMATNINPNSPNRSGHYPLSIAASWSELDMLALLLKGASDVNQHNRNRYLTTPLMESTRDGQVEIAKLLLSHGAKVNLLDLHKDNALNWSVFFGRAPMVQLLLENMADTSQVGQQTNDNAMDIALRQGVPDVIALLQKAGAKSSKLPK
ncbi:MAG: ankyrin repeat domain-containing protein [Undibacterium sp.]|nr:ankyrin repeat domain-containing protein [Undibacterium sp.]